jgi:hypothetical protein
LRLADEGTYRNGFVADGRAGVMASNQAARAWWQLGLDDQLKRQNRVTYGR